MIPSPTTMLSLDQQRLIRYLDLSIKKQRYGTITVTLIVKDGEPIVDSCRLVKMKRVKYKTPTADVDRNKELGL